MTVETTGGNTDAFAKAFDALRKKRLLIGIPSENNTRQGEKIAGRDVGNAEIGYWQEFGTATIPARPFLVPGVAAVQDKITAKLREAVTEAMAGNTAAIEQKLGEAGIIAVNSVKNRISAGIPPPLAPVTILARQIRAPGVHYRTRARMAEDPAFRKAWLKAHPEYKSKYKRIAAADVDTTPLIDTSSLINSITWVVRDR